MKCRTGLLVLTVLALSNLTFGEKPNADFSISITSIEYHEHTTDKPYKVEAKTTASAPTVYYKLSCKNGAADLEVGRSYMATEATQEGVKTLALWYKTQRDPTIIGLECDIQSEKVVAADKEKQR